MVEDAFHVLAAMTSARQMAACKTDWSTVNARSQPRYLEHNDKFFFYHAMLSDAL